MLLFDVLRLHHPDLDPHRCKLHLAVWNGEDDPLKVFFAGYFEGWQTWQTKKNFERDFIVSLIKLPGRDRWLFAGCYRRLSRAWVEEPGPPHHSYQTTEIEETMPLAGRVVIGFHRSGRASYLNAENWASGLEMRELLERRLAVSDFPGYSNVLLSKATLDLIITQDVPSWRGALSAVAGVYLITDTETGKLYVGSATGKGGIWSRWSQYATTGHGDNRDIRKLLKAKGEDYARHFQYAVLEIADTHASDDQVRSREEHWKLALASREHGYNAN